KARAVGIRRKRDAVPERAVGIVVGVQDRVRRPVGPEVQWIGMDAAKRASQRLRELLEQRADRRRVHAAVALPARGAHRKLALLLAGVVHSDAEALRMLTILGAEV